MEEKQHFTQTNRWDQLVEAIGRISGRQSSRYSEQN